MPPRVPPTIAPVRAFEEVLFGGASGVAEGSVDAVVEEAVVVDVDVSVVEAEDSVVVEADDSVEVEDDVRDALALVLVTPPIVVGWLSRVGLLVSGTDICE